VALNDALAEVRSLAIHPSQQGKGLGGHIVLQLVQMARIRGFSQVCALTLRENFFVRLGFELVDRWSISPKVWQACIYCPQIPPLRRGGRLDEPGREAGAEEARQTGGLEPPAQVERVAAAQACVSMNWGLMILTGKDFHQGLHILMTDYQKLMARPN
jgi:hypothetical protein